MLWIGMMILAFLDFFHHMATPIIKCRWGHLKDPILAAAKFIFKKLLKCSGAGKGIAFFPFQYGFPDPIF